MGRLSKRLISVVTTTIVAASLVFSNINLTVAKAYTNEKIESSNSEVLQADSIQNGVVLHAWCWSFNEIKNRLDEIAEAGYTAIQTSPAQACMVGDGGHNNTLINTLSNPTWYYHYQPTFYTLGNYQLGTAEEFKSMVKAAHDKNIKIIVDVVGNHVADTSNSSLVDGELYSNCHSIGRVGNWKDRYQVTQGDVIGLKDLNTGSKVVQNKMSAYLKELMNAGADGIRFDAAKSIELPSDCDNSNIASDYWPTVINAAKSVNPNVFIYGEVLQGDEPGTNFKSYPKYMNVTGSTYSWYVRSAVGYAVWEDENKNLHPGDETSDGKPEPKITENILNKYVECEARDGSIPNSKIVTFVETHDTYANGGASRCLSQNQIQMAWAILAAREGSVPLYFNRPTTQNFGNDYMHPQGEPYKTVGQSGSDDFKQKNVVEMNKFHNLMAKNDQKEKISSITNKIMKIERGDQGIVLVNVGGNTNIDTPTSLKDGTYTNRAENGGTFKVENGKLTGSLNGSSIAILYEGGTITTEPEATISKEGGEFTGDSINVTIGLKNATSGTYKIGNQSEKTYTDTTKIEVGKDLKEGESETVKLSATDGKVTNKKSVTFTKKATPVYSGDIYIQKPNGWGNNINIYIYSGKDSLKVWPGTAMKDEGNGLYSFDLPDSWGDCSVLFNDGGSNQYPASGQPGLEYKAGTCMIYKDGKWEELSKGVKITSLTADQESVSAGAEVVFTASAENGTTPYTYSYKITNSNNKSEDVTVNKNKCTWKTSKAGDYTVVCTVKDSEGNSSSKTMKYTVKEVNEADPVIDKISAKLSGDNIIYTVKASGGKVETKLLFYKFYIINEDGSKEVGQNYSLNNTFTTSKNNSKILVQVQNSINTTVEKEYEYTGVINKFSAGMNLSVSSPQYIGTKITIKGTSKNATGKVKYKFTIKNPNGSSSVIKELNTTSSYTWSPTVVGTYTIIVYAIDEDGNKDSVEESYIIKNSDLKITSVNPSNDFTKGVNQNISLSLNTSGGEGTVKTRIEVVNNSTKEQTIVKDYSTSKSATWKPTKVGEYTIYFIAKDNKKTVKKSVSCKVIKGLSISKLAVSVESPQPVKTSIKFAPIVSGTTGTVKYKCIVYDSANNSTVIQNYSTNKLIAWVPIKADTYRVVISVTDSTGVVKSVSRNYVIQKNKILKINNVNTSASSPQNVGSSITFKINATGAEKYAVAVVNESGKTTVIKNYTSSSEATWKPTTAGNYKVYCKAKDSNGKIVYKVLNYVIKQNKTLKINNVTTSASSPQNVGSSITFKINATGAEKYAFAVVNESGKTTVIKNYTSSYVATWKPTIAGTYKVYCKAKDSKGKIVIKAFDYTIK